MNHAKSLRTAQQIVDHVCCGCNEAEAQQKAIKACQSVANSFRRKAKKHALEIAPVNFTLRAEGAEACVRALRGETHGTKA